MGERNEVDEVVQDTFVRAFASLDGFRGESSLRSWLFTIARNLMRDRMRAPSRAAADGGARRMDTRSVEHDALDSAIADETAARMRAAVARLSPMRRDLFTLRVSDGMSYKEIAEALGSSEGAARVHYHHALRAIEGMLND